MIVYKGFTEDLTSVMGNGDKKTCTFYPGITLEVPESQTGKSGFHCCENPFECLAYYPLGQGNRYFVVEAQGDINEDRGARIACTKITLVKELSIKEFAGHGIMYMVKHPKRADWQQDRRMCQVTKNEACAEEKGAVAVSRGPQPVAWGAAGSVVGLIREPEPGKITHARLFAVTEEQQGRKYTIGENGEMIVSNDL